MRMPGLILALLLSFWIVTANAQDCTDYGRFPGLVGAEPAGSGVVSAIALDGALSVVGEAGGIATIDVRDPAHPVRLGALSLGATPTAVAAAGRVAYVAAGSLGLKVVDCADPAAPTVAGTVAALSSINAVKLAGGLLCVADGSWWRLLSVVEPLAPALQAQVDMGNNVFDVIMDSARLVVTSGTTGGITIPGHGWLDLYDISSATTPVALGRYSPSYVDQELSGEGTSLGSLAIRGDRVYCAYMSWHRTGSSLYGNLQVTAVYGVSVHDLTTPSALDPVTSIPGYLGNLSVNGHMLLGGSEAHLIKGFDLDDPALPVVSSFAPPSQVACLAAGGGLLAVGTSADGLQLFLLPDDPANNFGGGQAPIPGWTREALVRVGDRLYCSWTQAWDTGQEQGDTGYLEVRSATAPFTSSKQISTGRYSRTYWYGTGFFAGGLAASGGLLLAATPNKVYAFSLADPANPGAAYLLWGGAPSATAAMQICTAGVLAFALHQNGNVYVLDLSNPAAAQLAATIPVPGATALSALGARLFVATADQIQAWDLTQPASPQPVGSLAVGGAAMAAGGSWLVVGGPAPAGSPLLGRLTWLDVSAGLPSAPSAETPVMQVPIALTLAQGTAYAVLAGTGVVPVRQSGVLGGPLVIAGGPEAIVEAQGCLAVQEDAGLVSVPLACTPSVPVLVSGLQAQATQAGVRLSWEIHGDLSATDLRLRATQGARDWMVPVVAIGADRFEALDSGSTAGGGLLTYHLEAFLGGAWLQLAQAEFDSNSVPRVTRLAGAVPNPFNPATDVRFSLGRMQSIRLALYDLAGRRLAVLASGIWPAGDHRLRWDGRDGRGRALSGGTYLLRLETEEGRQARKVTLIK